MPSRDKPYCVETALRTVRCFRTRRNAKKKCAALERRGIRCSVSKYLYR